MRDPGRITVERLRAGAEARVLTAGHLFDRPPDPAAVADFLGRPDHHFLLASMDGEPAGFALVHELPRIDGPRPKLLLYEIGTARAYRRRGVGRALIEAVKELGRAHHARCVFAIADEENGAALALYASTGAVRPSPSEAVVEYEL